MKRSVFHGVVIAVLVVAAVSGCASSIPAPTGTPAPSPSASPTPAAAPSIPALPGNALFQISATATASNGAIADLLEIVYQPTAPTAADTALLDSQCNYPSVPSFQGQPSWESQYPRPVYMIASITATLRPGSRAWSNTTDPLIFDFMPLSAYSGDYKQVNSPCAAGSILVPGTIHGVAPLWSSNEVSGPYGWATAAGGYGFTGGGNDPGGPNLGGKAIVNNCTVQLSAGAAAANPAVAAWKTQQYQFAAGCVFRGAGS
jgi:hypothetical protein